MGLLRTPRGLRPQPPADQPAFKASSGGKAEGTLASWERHPSKA